MDSSDDVELGVLMVVVMRIPMMMFVIAMVVMSVGVIVMVAVMVAVIVGLIVGLIVALTAAVVMGVTVVIGLAVAVMMMTVTAVVTVVVVMTALVVGRRVVETMGVGIDPADLTVAARVQRQPVAPVEQRQGVVEQRLLGWGTRRMFKADQVDARDFELQAQIGAVLGEIAGGLAVDVGRVLTQGIGNRRQRREADHDGQQQSGRHGLCIHYSGSIGVGERYTITMPNNAS